MLKLQSHHLNAIVSHAIETSPQECCGLIGGIDFLSHSIYKVNNVAANPLSTYEAAPEELFSAQKTMRERGEQLLAIYHSHPRATEPIPSETDVRLAYYPAALYLIIGLAGAEPTVRAFHISEQAQTWKQVEYEIADE
jgi:proteasome lid subunit RPN8/RPN11